MAGIIIVPGVELHRRRNHCQHHHEGTPYHDHPSYRSQLEQSMRMTTTTMDEAALKARQRLEEKLGYVRPSRLNRVQANEGRGNNTISLGDNHDHLVSRILRRPWHFQINSSKSKGQLCAVCLEDFQAEQPVMELSCSHKYHSECLLPWLAEHPNCPSCRTPVQS